MKTKLTLKLDPEIIERASEYAKDSGTSLSILIENYLQSLATTKYEKRKINPIVNSLTGVITLDEKKDYKESYTKHLIKKYK